MRRSIASIAITLTVGALAACGDSPTAPRAFAGGAIDGQPSDQLAPDVTLAMIAPLSGFGNGAVSAINNLHETAGWNYTTGSMYHAFFRSATGVMTDLGSLGGGSVALSMNDASSVVGFSYAASGTYHAFLSRIVAGKRTMVDLGTVAGGDRSAAYGINNLGTVVGFIYTGDGKQHAARWVPPMYVGEDLGTFAGGARSFAYAINDAGTIVGSASTPAGVNHAFSWTSTAAGLQDLGTLGGASSTARAINARGDIAGWSTTSANVFHAFRKLASSTMTDLGSGTVPSYAYSISASGQVVGWSQSSVGAERALYWVVNSIDAADLGTTTAQTYAINDKNEAVGTSGQQATIWYIGNHSPVAAFTGPSHSKALQTANFDASTSTDQDGDALTYSWNFGDTGSATNTATGVTASHLYTVKGDYSVSLTVTDTHGFSSAISTPIKIN